MRKKLIVILVALSSPVAAQTKPFSVVEASIADMRTALEQKRTTSREIVQQYLTRIALYEDQLQRGHHGEPARAGDRRLARSRARAGTDPRTAARHSGRAQGQHSHDGHADDRRRARVRRSRAAVRGDADEESRRTPARSSSPRRSSPSSPTGSRAECPATTTGSMATA